MGMGAWEHGGLGVSPARVAIHRWGRHSCLPTLDIRRSTFDVECSMFDVHSPQPPRPHAARSTFIPLSSHAHMPLPPVCRRRGRFLECGGFVPKGHAAAFTSAGGRSPAVPAEASANSGRCPHAVRLTFIPSSPCTRAPTPPCHCPLSAGAGGHTPVGQAFLPANAGHPPFNVRC